MTKAKVKVPTNIAFVKYWGKNPNWEKYHIPTKSSVSFTTDGLYTTTEVEVKKGNSKINFNLNGKHISPEMPEFEYVKEFFDKFFELYPNIKNYDYEIVTENNFPTAAGFASSASGFAALVMATVKALENEFGENALSDDKLSAIARLGSGSATRSIPYAGGIVKWDRGITPETKFDESKLNEVIYSSYAQTIVPPEQLEDIVMIYTHVEKKEKKVKSRAGMKTSLKTCPVYYDWVNHEENVIIPKVLELVKKKDWSGLFDVIMECSNALHAVMMYTQPTIVYLNDQSFEIINTILNVNDKHGKTVCAYTYDAGPNAIVFTTKQYKEEVVSELEKILGKDGLFVTKVGKGPEYL